MITEQTTHSTPGSAVIPPAASNRAATSSGTIDDAIATVATHKDEWVTITIPERIRILDQIARATRDVAERWVSEALRAKGLVRGGPYAAEEWLAGPVILLRNLRLLKQSLSEIERFGSPQLPGRPTTLSDGQVVAPVFPASVYDRLLFRGFSAEVWMEPEVRLNELRQTQGGAYRLKRSGKDLSGTVALVLGAGNVASIGPTDVLYKLFVEDQVVVLKMNPVNEYLGPVIELIFASLVDQGFLRLVYGGVSEGKYLCEHPEISEIHITGSDKTHDAIVFGVGEEGARRKLEKHAANNRRVTSELGNVSPLIVVPGPWSASDFEFHGENIASMLTNNAGFNCNAARMIIQHTDWSGRPKLLGQVRRVLKSAPARSAYYPGAAERHDAFIEKHPEAEQFGARGITVLPWTLIPALNPDETNDICFTTEAFCGVIGEVGLKAETVAEYVEKAVDFCNEVMWGSLNVSILVHPHSMRDPTVRRAVERAISQLRYGTVAINHWPALSYGLTSPTWGAFPGHPDDDIQSGRGVVHNTYLFDRAQKSVLRGPFRLRPKPPWFISHKKAEDLARRLAHFEYQPSLKKLPGLLVSAVRG